MAVLYWKRRDILIDTEVWLFVDSLNISIDISQRSDKIVEIIRPLDDNKAIFKFIIKLLV